MAVRLEMAKAIVQKFDQQEDAFANLKIAIVNAQSFYFSNKTSFVATARNATAINKNTNYRTNKAVIVNYSSELFKIVFADKN